MRSPLGASASEDKTHSESEHSDVEQGELYRLVVTCVDIALQLKIAVPASSPGSSDTSSENGKKPSPSRDDSGVVLFNDEMLARALVESRRDSVEPLGHQSPDVDANTWGGETIRPRRSLRSIVPTLRPLAPNHLRSDSPPGLDNEPEVITNQDKLDTLRASTRGTRKPTYHCQIFATDRPCAGGTPFCHVFALSTPRRNVDSFCNTSPQVPGAPKPARSKCVTDLDSW
ncbi:hypothetical protein LIA77_04753 [Sarocladium implicatum]|nr:hypothetical protein LIA77_04753 [Sarocladium implicatum]